MFVVTVEEMKRFEQETMSKKQLAEIDLMKIAGDKIAKDFLSRVNPKSEKKISIFAGVGNNGGDALMCATVLQNTGYSPDIYIVGDVKKASDAFLHYFDAVGKIELIYSESSLEDHQTDIFESDYIIEGIFGIGLSKPIVGYRKQLIQYINESKTVVYSIDIPSGIHPENGQILGCAVKANYTGIMGMYKIGNLIGEAMDYQGDSQLLDINLSLEQTYPAQKIDAENYVFNIPSRKHNAHKYNFGYGVFIGGSKGMMGSIQMSAIAGMKTGLGIAKIITGPIDYSFTQMYPELVFEDDLGEESVSLLDKANVVVFGPGIKHHPDHKILLDELLKRDIPLVIDGTGFSYIEPKKYKNRSMILTPHAGEFARFFGIKVEELLSNPMKYIKKATSLGFHVLLKGSCNIIASGEDVRFFPVTHTGLGTAGSGDVVSGILAGMLMNFDILPALVNTVYVQNRTAQFVTNQTGETSLLASDLLKHIHMVIKENE